MNGNSAYGASISNSLLRAYPVPSDWAVSGRG